MQHSDLLIALGSRFDDRVTGKVPAFAPHAKIIHVDIDPAEIGKVRRADVGIAADCRAAIEAITAAVEAELARNRHRRPRPGRLERHAGRLAGRPSAVLRPGGRRAAQAAVLHRAAARPHPRRHDRRLRRGPAPDVDVAVLEVQPPLHLGQLRRPRHDGLRRAGGHRRQGRQARPHGVGHRRRRLLPDDRPGARHRQRRAGADQGGDPQQRLPRHGPPVAGAVLQGALQRGVPLARPARLREVGRGHGLRGPAGREPRGRRPHHREGQRHRRPARSSSTSGSTTGRRSTRWWRPGRRTTRSSSARPRGRGVTDGRGMRYGATHHILSVLVENRPAVLDPGDEPVLPAGLQHLLAGRQPDRRRALLPHDDRGRRRIGPAGAGDPPARQAHQRGRDQGVVGRARPSSGS